MKSHSINLSIFDVFKIGPGPSSSHTIAPMLAAADFIERVSELRPPLGAAVSLEVSLHGSLAATGEGHGTHRAVLGGLLGWRPDTCDCERLLALFSNASDSYEIAAAGTRIPFSLANMRFITKHREFPYQNTIEFELVADGETLAFERYYSIGGGFIKRDGEQETPSVEIPYEYSDMRGFRKILRKTGLSIAEVMLENESAVSGLSKNEIEAKLDELLAAMDDSVENGLRADGILPGPIGLQRKARRLFERAESGGSEIERSLARLNAYALAVSEENAAGKKVVTAPTSGASGVLPGVVRMFRRDFQIPDEKAREGLLAAALIAFIAKHNASIAGADVGCQGEVGVASSMAAAFAAAVKGGDARRVENAAEIALEHHLGLTCDPIDGYVQVPCIERNAVGAVTAFNAYVLASVGDPARQKISFDEVVDAMRETGIDMSKDYKGTSKGGLAVCCACC